MHVSITFFFLILHKIVCLGKIHRLCKWLECLLKTSNPDFLNKNKKPTFCYWYNNKISNMRLKIILQNWKWWVLLSSCMKRKKLERPEEILQCVFVSNFTKGFFCSLFFGVWNYPNWTSVKTCFKYVMMICEMMMIVSSRVCVCAHSKKSMILILSLVFCKK